MGMAETYRKAGVRRTNIRACAAFACAGLTFVLGCAAPPSAAMRTVYAWRTLAGQPGGLGNVDGKGGQARFCQPCGVAVDASGTFYVADYYNYAIRKVTPDGCVTTFAGAVGEPGGNDGVGGAARFDRPSGIAADKTGNLYVADSGNHTVRLIVPGGEVTTLGGAPNAMSCADGVGADARFAQPSGIAVDVDGRLYVSDACNNRIAIGTPFAEFRRFEPQIVAAQPSLPSAAGAIPETPYTWDVFVGSPGRPGLDDGRGGGARLAGPQTLAFGADGVLTVADGTAGMLRRIRPDGRVETVSMRRDVLCAPVAVAVDRRGFCAVSSGLHALVVVSPDGAGDAARLSRPTAVVCAPDGNFYVACGDRIRRVTTEGVVTTLDAGVAFGKLDGLAVDRRGNLYAADRGRHAIWRIAPNGRTVRLAGSEQTMGGGGWLVTGMTVDRVGNVYVADSVRACIVRGKPQ